jgi:serine/threonine-protein kinase
VIGTQLGHYKIISQLGRGGMASVFKAEQAGLGRLVAIKLVHP